MNKKDTKKQTEPVSVYAKLRKGSLVIIVSGTGLLIETDERDGWTGTIEHDGQSSEDVVAELVAMGYEEEQA